ncbi:hypothetical protein VP249E411_P0141 [Vibrio phage 249E41-1]|nr:hypothetical protein VP249E411_P0141 [Vibrio phage 249E41-1]
MFWYIALFPLSDLFVCGILYSGEVKHNNIILNLFT